MSTHIGDAWRAALAHRHVRECTALDRARPGQIRDFHHRLLVVRHVIIFGYGHGLQRAIIDESQHRTPERLVMAQH